MKSQIKVCFSHYRELKLLVAVSSAVSLTVLLDALPVMAQDHLAQGATTQEIVQNVTSEDSSLFQALPEAESSAVDGLRGNRGSGNTRRDADPLNSQYLLGPGDQVSISVFGYDEYAGTYGVLSDGTISLPVLGPIVADNHTLASFDAALTEELNRLLVEPDVTVQLVGRRAITITVAGAVQRPGPVQVVDQTQTSSSLRMPTISTALSEAGGVTRKADIRRVILTRQLPNGELASSTLNLWDSIWIEDDLSAGRLTGQGAEHLILRDGDTIVVPELAEGEELDERLVARSTLAPDTVRVRVVGEVTSPGEVLVPPASSLSSAVAIAGGPTDNAALNRVELIRLNEEGAIESQEVDLRNLIDEVQIQEGDVVIVPEQNASTVLRWAQRILNPFGSILNILNRL
ncbi:MAG: polysaccharide export protein [Leptolyngbya sp. SIO1D8]|nr:polysaccharide export protein [Leptolyngbya sp. SIO1D8]